VNGPVNLGNSTLNLSLGSGFAAGASSGATFTIIQSTNPIIGTFAGLPEGFTLVVGGKTFTISYKSNMVVLTLK
jgi:hypothetical protein